MDYKQLSNIPLKSLLETKISQLDLALPKKYQKQLDTLAANLTQKNIKWTPHTWLADEWFSPDGISGFAIPFTLAHPRLIKLEEKYLGFCEGKKIKDFYKLCAHETGHAIDNTFKLRLKKTRQKLFGLTSLNYPDSYKPNPNTTDFVNFCGDFYAQAHPDEDWAETFAVWFTNRTWRSEYFKTKAFDKLAYIDRTISNLKNISPTLKNKTPLHYQTDNRTIREYFEDKAKQFNINQTGFYNQKLNNSFSKTKTALCAITFIDQNKKQIINSIHSDNKKNIHAWFISKCLNSLKDECKKENFRLKYSSYRSQKQIQSLVEENLDLFIKTGGTRIYM